MSAAPPLRLGVVGVGALDAARAAAAPTQGDVREAVVVEALCDPVLERAQAAARDYGVPKAYASLDELLADDEIDAVTIASPIGLHAEHGRLALEAGKHVHFNKTMSTTVAEADALIALAAAQGPAHRRLARRGAAPAAHAHARADRRGRDRQAQLGDLRRARSAATTSRRSPSGMARLGRCDRPVLVLQEAGRRAALRHDGVRAARADERARPGQAGDGAVGHACCPSASSAAAASTPRWTTTPSLLLDFGDGVFAVAHGTAGGTRRSRTFAAACYFGTDGEIRGVLLNGEPFDFPGRELTLGAPPSDWDAQMRVLPHVVGPHREIPEPHVFEDVMQLVDWVRDGTPSPVTAEHARHVIDIIESTYRSAETGSTERLSTTFEWPARARTGGAP